MQRLRVIGAVITALAVLGGTAACGDDQAGSSDEPVVVDITLEGGRITPSGEVVKVGAGQPIDLVVTADTSGVLHVHSDPEHEFPFDSGTETFKIQIDRPGVVEVELHEPAYLIAKLEVR